MLGNRIEAILKEDVQKVFDHFSVCFNIRILFYTLTGEMPRVGLNQSDSAYCRMVQDKLYGEGACLALDETKRREAARQGDIVCYTCHAGLVEAIKPIYHKDKLLGFFAIGQFRSEDALPPGVASDWQASQGSVDFESAYLSLPLVPKERLDSILGLFSVLADYIVSQRMVSIEGSLLEELLSFMEANLHRDLSLAEVAEYAGKSPSTVSHLFKQESGKSFKRTLVEMKLEKAERYMMDEPGTSVREAAASVGYDDPLYFSRIYKRYRGVCPSSVEARLRRLPPVDGDIERSPD